VAVGVAALLTTLSVMNGFQEDIRKKVIGAQAHVVVFGRMEKPVYDSLEKNLRLEPEISAVAPMIYGQAILTFRGRSMGIVLRGLDPEREKAVNDLSGSLTSGGWKANLRLGEKAPPPAIVLGEELAKNMGVWPGDDVALVSPQEVATSVGIFPKIKKFRVSGLIKTGYYEFDNTMAYANLSDAADFLNLGGAVTGAAIKLKDIEKAPAAAKKAALLAGFPYTVKTFAQLNSTLYAALRLEKFVMSLILALIILVAALNIASNLILLGTEKLRDIGIMRAMGATPAVIRKIFWWEGFLIATMGTALGLALGFALCWVIATFNFVELPADIYYITKVPVSIRWVDVAAITAGSYILCFLATLYPATRGSKVKPVDAIRYG